MFRPTNPLVRGLLAAVVAAPVLASFSLAGAGDSTTATEAETAGIPKIALRELWKNVEFVRPVQPLARPDRPGEVWILEQAGRIKAVSLDQPGAAEARPVLDIVDDVYISFNEEGLLSLAFHPNFGNADPATDGARDVFIFYTKEKPRRMTLSRFTMDAGGDRIDPRTEKVVIEVEQPWANHNGGTVLFGPDGMLYLSYGDGGAANDPRGYSQNLESLLGSVIRIDVRNRPDGSGYSIPSDNPFVGRDDARGEIWAYGLRNIWRMHFDRANGDLYGGDVGQNKWEEIDVIVRGGNYGWNAKEGTHTFRPRGGRVSEIPSGVELIEPIAEYPHPGDISVTGGVVYRGPKYAAMQGVYLYADFQSGKFWGLRAENGRLTEGPEVILESPGNMITSFGETLEGEVLVTSFDGSQKPDATGSVWIVEAR